MEREDSDMLPELVDVYATAAFSRCPNSQLNQDYLDSVCRFVTSKDHLNIASIHHDRIFTFGANNTGTFEHSVQFKLL